MVSGVGGIASFEDPAAFLEVVDGVGRVSQHPCDQTAPRECNRERQVLAELPPERDGFVMAPA
jgi:hypothetical protein